MNLSLNTWPGFHLSENVNILLKKEKFDAIEVFILIFKAIYLVS